MPRRIAPTLLAALVLCPALLAPQRAPAKPRATPPASSAELRAQSNQAFEQGVKLFQAGRVAEALALFRESYRLLPRPSTLYNIGQSELGLDHPLEAIEALNQYAAQGGTNAINEFLKEAEGKVCKLSLSVSPADASARVDGAPVAPGELRLNPGDHVVEVSAAGHRPSLSRVQLARGERKVLSIALTAEATAPGASAAASSAPATPTPPAATAPVGSAGAPAGQARKGARSPYDGYFWATAGAAAVFVSAGSIAGVLALKNADTYNGQAPGHRDASLRSAGETQRLMADVFFAAGLLSGVGAFVLSRRQPAADQAWRWQPSVGVGPSGGQVGVRVDL